MALSYWIASDWPPVTLATVIAVSGSTAMHARLAMGRSPTLVQICLSAAVLYAVGAPLMLVTVAVISGVTAGDLIAHSTGRLSVLRAGVGMGVAVTTVVILENAAAAPGPAGAAFRDVLGGVVGALLSGPLLLTVGPFAEWLLGHTTRLTMTEWLSYEHPLLRDLAVAAPGTFQHSVNVGVLADAAARAIGADALLVRLGGLYHDVGKLRTPEYFVENQRGINPHDRLTPPESAGILRAHVTDGVSLVAAHGMGDRIADFVREHHGTGCMRFFRDKAAALGASEDPDETYCYAGPRPQSAETAIIMLADQLEATARASPPTDEVVCTQMVERTLDRVAAERQLQDTGLTSDHLEKIRVAFTEALMAMHHRRMTYPPSSAAPRQPRRMALVPRLLGRSR